MSDFNVQSLPINEVKNSAFPVDSLPPVITDFIEVEVTSSTGHEGPSVDPAEYENIQLFQLKEEDVENALWANQSALLFNKDISLRQIAHEIFPKIDLQGVWDAYNSATNVDDAMVKVEEELTSQFCIFNIMAKPAGTITASSLLSK